MLKHQSFNSLEFLFYREVARFKLESSPQIFMQLSGEEKRHCR